jgi:D-glutamate cyclase
VLLNVSNSKAQSHISSNFLVTVLCVSMRSKLAILDKAVDALQDVIGTDAGDRGMKSLIVPGDLRKASSILANLAPPSHVAVLSGFPCCVNEFPPTETDGPPGAVTLVRAAYQLGHRVTLVTDECNEAVFAAALGDLQQKDGISLQVFPDNMTPSDDVRLEELAKSCGLIVACERAGPAQDGHCYTMRGIDMNEKGLIAPLHRLVEMRSCPFLAIGDGGNEMGMGKVYPLIISNPKIANSEKIACVIKADYLVASSVSNWGGYALAAGAALMKSKSAAEIREWVDKCVPTEEEEVALLQRCVVIGCRDGVSGKVEATVDGMPLETSMECLREIRNTALLTCDEMQSLERKDSL